MKSEILTVLPIQNARHTAVLQQEAADFSSVSYQKGYGSIVQAGVSVSGKVSATVTVDLEIETYSSSSYQETSNDYSTYGDTTITEHLRESEKTQDYKDWWFWLFSASGKDHEHYKDSQSETVSITDNRTSQSLTNNFSEKKQTFHVSGTFTVTSDSYVPTTAYLYIEVLNIRTADGSTTTVISQNSQPVAADGNGSTSGLSAQGQLNIVPISGT